MEDWHVEYHSHATDERGFLYATSFADMNMLLARRNSAVIVIDVTQDDPLPVETTVRGLGGGDPIKTCRSRFWVRQMMVIAYTACYWYCAVLSDCVCHSEEREAIF